MRALPIRASRLALALAVSLPAFLGACQDPVSLSDGPDPSPRPAARAPQGTSTAAWNQVARDLVVEHRTNVPASIRMFALLSVAQYNAIVATQPPGPQRPDVGRSAAERASTRGAIAGASAAVLAYVYPQEEANLATLVSQQAAEPARGRDRHASFAAGEAIGRAAAAALIDRARTDRFFEPFTGTVPACAGCWVATPTPPAFATLGQAKPFLLASNAQFRPAPPPAFGSPAFLAELAEVRRIADTRTAEQDSIAKFWELPLGTVGAQGYFNQVASALTAKYHRSERETAHALALLNVAAFDAIIASHEAKYHYWLLRPTQADPAIVRAIGLPSFPAYPSNHSALAGVAAGVLGTLFPAERTRLDAMAAEGAISRLYGGIHYRVDTEAGLALGRSVAAWVLAHDVSGREPFAFP